MIENLPVKVDDVGRIVIPKKIRKILNIQYNEELLLSVKDGNIEIKKEVMNTELNGIIEKIKIIKNNYDLDFVICDDYKVVYATEEYKYIKNKRTKKMKVHDIKYDNKTEIVSGIIIDKPHYYCLLSFDNYTSGKLFVIFNDNNDRKYANLVINLLK